MKFFYFLVFTALALPQAGYTQPRRSLQLNFTDHFQVNQTIGDGQKGRTYGRWRQTIKERPVERVTVALRRTAGSNDTYVNLRYKGGQTFENGKREYLRDGDLKALSWNVNNTNPQGKPLVLNVYKGAVHIQSVTVHYTQPRKHFDPRLQPRPKPPTHTVPRGGSDGGDYQQNNDDNDRYEDEDEVARRCLNRRIRPPRIEVAKVRDSGGIFSGKLRVQGSIVGMCVEEAGYFEKGRLKERFEFPYTSRFKRREFSIQARTGRQGKIRVLTSDGKEEVVEIDDLARDRN